MGGFYYTLAHAGRGKLCALLGIFLILTAQGSAFGASIGISVTISGYRDAPLEHFSLHHRRYRALTRGVTFGMLTVQAQDERLNSGIVARP